MEKLIPGISEDVSSAGGRLTPEGLVWHHVPSAHVDGRHGVMRLVSTKQHKPGSVWWNVLHIKPNKGQSYGNYAELKPFREQ